MTLPETLRLLHHTASRADAPAPWDALDPDEQSGWIALAAWVRAERRRVRELAAGVADAVKERFVGLAIDAEHDVAAGEYSARAVGALVVRDAIRAIDLATIKGDDNE